MCLPFPIFDPNEKAPAVSIGVPNWEHRSDQRYRPPPAEHDKRCLRFALREPLAQPLSNAEEVGYRPILRCRIQLCKGRLRK